MTANKCLERVNFEDALDLTATGKYNILLLTTCCLLILAMYLDIFGFSVVLPVAACDLQLTTNQQAILSAIPLIGVMLSSYPWGLCADTMGRRPVLLVAMTMGVVLNLSASMAPGFASLAALKLLSASFTSSANAAGFVLLGECTPKRYRNRFMFFMASATIFGQFIICLFALPVFQLTFRITISSMEYRPWRLLMQLITLPGALGLLGLIFVHESPKYLLTKGYDVKALAVLEKMYKFNLGSNVAFPITSLLSDDKKGSTTQNFFKTLKVQTLPLFQPPLLKNSLKLYYVLLSAYMTSTGFTMWVATMTNAYFSGIDSSGLTFCEVASTATSLATRNGDILINNCCPWIWFCKHTSDSCLIRRSL